MEAIELMQDRYKVINPYPNSPYKVGDLVEISDSGTSFHCTTTKEYDSFREDILDVENYFSIKLIGEYPNLFRKLAWYEDRDESIMRGIKYMKPPASADSDIVYKVKNIDLQELETSMWCIYFEDAETDVIPYNINYWLPATELEYTQYITSQSKK